METHIEKTVPNVKNFQIEERDWQHVTQLKSQIPSTTSFGDPQMEAIFSRFPHQNHDPQQFLSCTIIPSQQQGYSTCIPSSSSSNHHHPNNHNNHHLWGTNQGPTINLESNNDHIEMQKRGLEDYIPHHYQGRRTKVAYYSPPPQPPPALADQNDFPYLSSWEASRSAHWRGGGGGGEDHFSNLTFSDLATNGVGTAGFVPGWGSSLNYPVNNTSFDGSSLCFNQILGGDMQNCGSLQYQSMCNTNSPLENMNSKYSNFNPTTLRAYNQVPTEQNEQEVAAAMMNLQNEVNAVPNTDSTDKVSRVVENQEPENGGDQVIDLNKTPAKRTRRRRYQPKVLSEKKPRKAPKPKTPKPPMETEQVKKKYVRKSKVEVNATPATPPREANEGVEMKEKEGNEVGDTKTPESVTKSCKRSLNFGLNGQAGESNFTRVSNGDACGDTIRNEHNESGDKRKRVELVVEALSGGIAYDLNCALSQELEDYLSLPTKDNIDNSQPAPNTLSKMKETIPHNAEILSENDAPLPAQQSTNSSPCASSSERKNRRGSKRSNPDIKEMDVGTMGPTLWPPNHAFIGNANIGEHNFLLPETCKKKRTEKVQRPNVPSQSSSVQPRHLNQEVGAQNQPRVDPSSSKYYCAPFGIEALASSNQCNVTMESVENNKSQLTGSWADLARLKKKRTTRARDLAQLAGSPSALPAKRGPKGPRLKKTDVSENGQTVALVPGSNLSPRSKISKKQSSENNELRLVLYRGDRSANNPTGCIRALPWAITTTSIEEITEWMKKLDINKGSYKMKVKRRTPKKGPQRNALQDHKALVPYRAQKQEQSNALVVYGRDGTMVPFDGPFEPVKKRRQRAKVDLDDETTKVWKLLLENIDNKGIDGTDEDKAQWWESERSVFRGRVDSFIARMRLVQGDRRFTPWKGSVLDSVIGVFLTQNVSDHLSSSAFMSLAAHFPLKSESSKSTLSEESATGLVGEPEICVIEPEESISWNDRTINQHTLSSTTKIVHEIYQSDEKEVLKIKELAERTDNSGSPKDSSSESSQKTPSSTVSNINSQTTASTFGDDRAKDDASSSQHSVMSSQNSTNSPNLVNVGMLNVFSESESRTQPITTASKFNYLDCSTSFLGLLKMAESPFLHETYHQTQDSLECMNTETRSFYKVQGTGTSNYLFNLNYHFPKGFEMLEVDSKAPNTSRKDENSSPTEQSNLTTENMSCYVLEGENMVMHSQSVVKEQSNTNASSPNGQTSSTSKSTILSQVNGDVTESTTELKRTSYDRKEVEHVSVQTYTSSEMNGNASKSNRGKNGRAKNDTFDWDSLRRDAQPNGIKKERTPNTMDSLDWEAVRHAHVSEIAEVIKERGMNNILAERIKDLLDRLVREHGSIDMEWLRDIPPDKAKEYLLSFRGLGLKSVECVRLLTLHHLAFPVDTNVGRIAVRLGWVPLQPLPESLQLHLLELYPVLESIQKYLWPRLCKLDQKTLYELHYHLITFGKVFCTKRQPNCNACPLRGECRHFASAFASARFALPGPEERSIMPSNASSSANTSSQASSNPLPLPLPLPPALGNEHPQNSRCVNGVGIIEASPSQLALPMPQTINYSERQSETKNCEPIVEVPASPDPEVEQTICCDIEDTFYEDPNEIPTIELNMKEFSQTLQNYFHTGESNALVALTPEAASIPTPKLKNISRLRTEHHVYELPDTHPLLKDLDKREPDDPCSYLLAIWTPGETADSFQPPERRCNPENPNSTCTEETCSYCSSFREANSQTVRGTLLIPCRTAMRGSFPLNGTYFQVNEVFADHDSSLQPIAVPRSWLWNLPRRTVYFGTSIPTIFRGLNTEDIQHCFWRGFVCVRGFDKKSRAPRPLMARLHFPASRMQKGAKNRGYDE